MPRLRRVDCSSPGIARRRRGRGFEYLDEHGERITDEETIERIRALVLPPAWRDVWICPDPRGHLQATGVDAAGRKQYRYHDAWRRRRDQEKFDEMLEFARALPAVRERVAADLAATEELTRERVLACAVRLLDRGFFRVGGEDYASENDSYGLATLRKEHVTVADGGDPVIRFDFPSKSGRRTVRSIVDAQIHPVVLRLKRRRGGGPELLAYRRGRAWADVRTEDVNEFVKAISGGDFSAKDFRTWNATVLAAVALAVSGAAARSKTARKRAVVRAVKEVAHYLGNTPAVARASYIDPRLFDRFDAGLTIGGALEGLVERGTDVSEPHVQASVEAAVLDLIGEEESEGIEKVA